MTASMTRIVGISGSLRQGSFNSALLRAAAELAPDGAHIEIGAIADIPLYDGDLEDESGRPAAVTRLQDRIAAADGLLIVTPEYNGSIPGVLKNAIDWLSRGDGEVARVFGGKPVALMGATPGGLGTVYAQQAWLPVLRAFRMRPWFGQPITLSRVHELFDGSGSLTDDATRERLAACIGEFVASIERAG